MQIKTKKGATGCAAQMLPLQDDSAKFVKKTKKKKPMPMPMCDMATAKYS